jgi:hypothetical protein
MGGGSRRMCIFFKIKLWGRGNDEKPIEMGR